jgi:hypothetical protein
MTKCGGCRRFLEKMTSYMQASGASWNSLGYNSLYMLQKMTSYMQASGASWNSLWYNSLYMRSHLTKSYICHFQGPYLSVGHDAHYGIIVFFLWQILVYCLTTPLTRIFRAWGGGVVVVVQKKRAAKGTGWNEFYEASCYAACVLMCANMLGRVGYKTNVSCYGL